MGFRNTHRLGDWLMIDEESGHVGYRSEMSEIWNGTFRRKKSFETRQPQEFIKARSDPRALTQVRSEQPYPVANDITPLCIGLTNIRTNTNGPASNIFTVGILPDDPGIGSMEIEADNNLGPFKVR